MACPGSRLEAAGPAVLVGTKVEFAQDLTGVATDDVPVVDEYADGCAVGNR